EGGGIDTRQSGRLVSGSLQLRSNGHLFLEPGAVLKGSENLDDYPPLDFHHNELGETRSLIWAMREHNVSIGGFGRIDFSGSHFMQLDQPDDRGPGGEKLFNLPGELRAEAVVRARARPTQPIFLHDCTRVRIENVELRDSPCWTITLSCCEDAQVRGISVYNSLVVPNCDGVNISSSRNVIVEGCHFHCADDCVAVGGITCWERPSENIIIGNCTMVSRSCGVRLGHLSSQVRNVHMHHLILSEGNRGIGIFADDGGCVENIQADHLILNTNLYAGFWWGKGEPLIISAAESTGIIRNVRVSQVSAISEGSIVLAGSGNNVTDIHLDDWYLTLRPSPKRTQLGNWIDLQPKECRRLEPHHFPWLYREGVSDVRLKDIRVNDHAAKSKGFSTEELS
ncbi:MAG: glycosyl hydrolase family 28 protein, partial [Kiritimatiellae bacterium]|nr:glycosyl hydrolase family 28 protein [Kiritimatiellia bacterium]